MADVRNLPKLKTHSHTLEPLWASDTGRHSNSGTYSGTFVGYFSQVVLEFGKTTQAEMTQIKDVIEIPILKDFIYKDSDTGNFISEDFYGNAITAKLNKWTGKYDPFSVTLTGVKKKK